MIANLKHAAQSGKPTMIGGGEFSAREVGRFVELFDELVHQLASALPYVEDGLEDPAYKPAIVAARIREIRSILERADP